MTEPARPSPTNGAPRASTEVSHQAIPRAARRATRSHVARPSMRVRTRCLTVPAQVLAADVAEGLDEAVIQRAIELVGQGGTSDLKEPPATAFARSLLELDLPAGSRLKWEETWQGAGLDLSLLLLVLKLRAVNAAGFAIVNELRDTATSFFIAKDNELLLTADPRGVNPGEVYSLPLQVNVPLSGFAGKRTAPKGTLDSPPRRPYPMDTADAAAVDALAAYIAPRVHALLGGPARLREQPVLAPLCAMAASVRAAVCEVRTDSGRFHWDVLDACLEALDLGPHRATAERVLLRDHEQHISIDTSSAPPRYASERWKGSLGLFADAADGRLETGVSAARVMPRLLTCLSVPEPY